MELDEVVARGRELHGVTDVREALEEVLANLVDEPTTAQPLTPVIPVLGVSACDDGWVGVLVRPSGHTTLHVGCSLVRMIEQVRDQETLGAVGVVAGSRRVEVTEWLHTRPTVAVFEVVDPDTRSERLVAAGLTLPAMYGGMGFAEEQLRAAGAAVLEGVRTFS